MRSDFEIKKRGDDGELAMNQWLQDNNFSFLYVNQDPESFPLLFRDNIKRPDFLVLIESLGLIAVDVKNYTPYKDSYSLKLSEELTQVLAFERLFRIPVWYAYKNKADMAWSWISALKAIEVGVKKLNHGTNEEFVTIDFEHFARIETGDDMGQLYTQRHQDLENIRTAGRPQ